MTNQISVNGREFELVQRTKWTLDAICQMSGNVIASAPSKPKIIKALEKLFPEAPEENAAALHSLPEVETPTEDAVSGTKASTPVKRPPKPEPNKTPKKESMRSVVLSMMLANANDDEILSQVAKDHPEAKFDMTHVKWYRSTFAKSGLIGAQFAPKRSAAYKDWLKNNS